MAPGFGRGPIFRRGDDMKLLFVVALAPTLFAHDMWIEPAVFVAQPGQMLGIKLRVGQELIGDPIARSTQLINRFIVTGPDGERPVVGRDGSDPAGYIRATGPGLMIVGYNSNASSVDLPAEKFNLYLKDEGLDSILALRARRNQDKAPSHEQFFRCAKSLVQAGPASSTQTDRVLGFPLELVAERNPYVLPPGADFAVRLTYENKPLAGAAVTAINRLNPGEKQTQRSGKDGRASFKLRGGGMWMIKSVHMVPAPAGSAHEWNSYWASLTFETGKN